MKQINSEILLRLQNSTKQFEKRNKNKGEIISKLPATLNIITNNLPVKDPTVAVNKNDLVPETVLSSNYNKNIQQSARDCLIQEIVRDKDDCASITVSSAKFNEQIAYYRQRKCQQFDLFKKKFRIEVSDENCT